MLAQVNGQLALSLSYQSMARIEQSYEVSRRSELLTSSFVSLFHLNPIKFFFLCPCFPKPSTLLSPRSVCPVKVGFEVQDAVSLKGSHKSAP
jgi:hypothetical protein